MLGGHDLKSLKNSKRGSELQMSLEEKAKLWHGHWLVRSSESETAESTIDFLAVCDLDLLFAAVSICDVRDLVRLEHHVMLMERVGLRKSLLEALTRPHEVLFTTMSNDKHWIHLDYLPHLAR